MRTATTGLVATTALIVLVLTSCGESGDGPEEAVSATTSTTTTTTTTTTATECRRPSSPNGVMVNTGCAADDVDDDPTTTTSTTTTSTTTTTSRPPPTTTTTTTTTVPEGPECEQSFDTQYIPANSWVTFGRNGVEVSLHKLSTLGVEVTSSDGEYDATRVEPTNWIYEGLQVTTTMGFDWVWDPWEERFVQRPGQVKIILRVWDCWDYVDGPDDLF